ncbi:MAG: CpcT/CpeT family chromophore lyase, partial [Phycisphaerales bacterium JB064]
ASESDPEAETQTLWMHMLPVETEMLGRVIYVEVHRDGSPWLPIRQALMRVYRYGDRLRLRTYEFREPARPEVLANLWLAPEHFPAQYIQPDELIPTMDIELDRGRGGYQGRTPHAYPTTRESAVEMTVELSVKPDELISTDTFYGVGGQPIEGAGATLRFERAQLPASVQVDDDGLVIITLAPGETDGPKTTEGDVLFLNYEGFRADGFKFDSSWDRGLAMRTLYPPRVIAGLKRGMEPWVQGMRRKLIIPPELGFGMAETKDVPGGTTLVFHGHLIRVDQGEPIPMEERKRRQEQP